MNVNKQKSLIRFTEKSKEPGLINLVCDAGIILTE